MRAPGRCIPVAFLAAMPAPAKMPAKLRSTAVFTLKGQQMANKSSRASGNGETNHGYFRRIFAENPKLLKSKSNQELLNRWLADHPGVTEVPKAVKTGLANVKSILRSRRRKRKAARTAVAAAAGPQAVTQEAPSRAPRKGGLPQLEELIDECLTLARNLDREGLEKIISLLRQARNEVVWKMGQ